MDPYLEAPDIWPDLHQGLAVTLRELLSATLPGRYVAFVQHAIEVDRVEGDVSAAAQPVSVGADITVLSAGGPPEASTAALATAVPAPLTIPIPLAREVKHFWIEIRSLPSRRLVTVIEIVSRANKLPGRDRRAYRKKKDGYLSSRVHFVEIDLLRVGRRWKVDQTEPSYPYRILVSRAARPRNAELWPFGIRDPIPVAPLPLESPDPDIALEVGRALSRVFDAARYAAVIDYRSAPPPPELPGPDAVWLAGHLSAARLRV